MQGDQGSKMSTFQAGYLKLSADSALEARSITAQNGLKECRLCPRQCGVDRTAGETGYCRTGAKAVVSGYDAHFGEESPLVGRHGSGTIFFSHCNLLCNFCQNYHTSHLGEGQEVNPEQLAACMLQLQQMGCHNINFVTPSHVVPQILSALAIAAQKGLNLPLVYNSGGYDSVETLKLLEGAVDIYMPDFKFRDDKIARMTCNAADYAQVAQKAVQEMHRQVGDLVVDGNGIAQKGLLLRHLVMPDNLAGTREVMKFIAEQISTNTYVNIMDQYRPCGKAADIPELARSITSQEYENAVREAMEMGITRLDQRRPRFVLF
jgi:putative pyruvate formate lyase activating enzyme